MVLRPFQLGSLAARHLRPLLLRLVGAAFLCLGVAHADDPPSADQPPAPVEELYRNMLETHPELKDGYTFLSDGWVARFRNGKKEFGRVVRREEDRVVLTFSGQEEVLWETKEGPVEERQNPEEAVPQKTDELPEGGKGIQLGEAKQLDPEVLGKVQKELLGRLWRDQAVRTKPSATAEQMHQVDQKNTRFLKHLIAKHGWIDATRFGQNAANAAFLIVQHSGDLSLMLTALPLIEKDVKAKLLDGGSYALLYDRIRTMQGQPQRFGSQIGKKGEGEWFLFSLEDPDRVDEWRKELGLPPLSEYLARFKSLPAIAGRTKESKQCFLWKVESEHGRLYLLGSLHHGRKDLYPLDPAIEDAYAESQVLSLEVSFNEGGQGAEKMSQVIASPPGKTLKEQLPEELLARLQRQLDTVGPEAGDVLRMRPWAVAMTLDALGSRRLDHSPEYGIDFYFFDKAKQEKKQTVWLESLDEKMSFLTSLDDEVGVLLLEWVLQRLESPKERIAEQFKAWQQGDSVAMVEILWSEFETHPKFQAFLPKMLHERNVRFVERLQSYLSSGQTHFVVIGIAHVLGERGVVQLLREQGARVEQVPPALNTKDSSRGSGG